MESFEMDAVTIKINVDDMNYLPLNTHSLSSTVYSTTTVYGGKWRMRIVTVMACIFLGGVKHFTKFFSGLHFYTLSQDIV